MLALRVARRVVFVSLGAVVGCGGNVPLDDGAKLPADTATSVDAGDDASVDVAEPEADAVAIDSSAAPDVLDAAGAPLASLKSNRDRLLDTYAARIKSTRCPTWAGLSKSQKGVFLTITDLLGKRSYLYDAPATGTRTGMLLEQALDHTLVLYAIRGAGSFGDGGGDNNRLFLGADATLISMMRNFAAGLPEWGKSSDIGGAHAPFDGTSETTTGQPRGQTQFWTVDSKMTTLTRPGVEGVSDPHVYEIDIDYDFFHNSNPEGTYPGGYGRTVYEKLWSPKGAGGSAEYDYVPTGC